MFVLLPIQNKNFSHGSVLTRKYFLFPYLIIISKHVAPIVIKLHWLVLWGCLPFRHSGAVNAGVPADLVRRVSLVTISSETPKSAIWCVCVCVCECVCVSIVVQSGMPVLHGYTTVQTLWLPHEAILFRSPTKHLFLELVQQYPSTPLQTSPLNYAN